MGQVHILPQKYYKIAKSVSFYSLTILSDTVLKNVRRDLCKCNDSL